jgi:hypothetical protein
MWPNISRILSADHKTHRREARTYTTLPAKALSNPDFKKD